MLKETEPAKEKNNRTDKKYVSLAFICLLSGLIIFTISFMGMQQQTGIGSFNQPVLSWMINHRTPQLTNVMHFITTIADPLIFTAIILAIAGIWAINRRELWRPLVLVASIGAAGTLSTALKTVTSNLRPPSINMITPFEMDYSFPSGHTIGVIVFMLIFGYMIFSRKSNAVQLSIWIIATFLVTGLVATSRLYLGYHWLTDVVASVGLGLVVLAIVIFSDLLVTHRLNN